MSFAGFKKFHVFRFYLRILLLSTITCSFVWDICRFNPPSIPEDFVPHHKFPASLENDFKSTEMAPAEVPPPEDNNLKVLIEGVATLVARCGKLFEDLSKEKNQFNPLFAFLNGGNGSDYYARKLWEERQKRGDQNKLWEEKKSHKTEQLTAERRGSILGEKALERNSKDSSSMVASAGSVNVQIKLSDTFTKPASVVSTSNIYCDRSGILCIGCVC